jgi:hypothetical protein
MKLKIIAYAVTFGLLFLSVGVEFSSNIVRAQFWPGTPPQMVTGPNPSSAQRNALNNVRSRVKWLQNATRSAPNYRTGAAEMLWQQLQFLRGSYNALTMTLYPQQASYGANEWAELNAGLDIIQEAFTNYQNDLTQGRLPTLALNDLCSVLRQASTVWLQELNKDCSRLQVGW